MSELSKQKEIGENMSDSRQLTTLVKELDNTLRTVKSVDEYLSRIAKAKEVLGKDSVELSEIIENNKNNLEQSLLEIGKFVQTALDHIQISDEELESASQQLKLFTNGTDEAIEYAEKELKGLEEGTYWARYWSGLLSRLKS
ncbi:hypothetical protein CL636_005035 [bacterium]|jgi:uncharacterized membrane protein YccC|nr:hypothetical protein [bacterium]|tara:strand:- start:1419 stop:1844 length:426 start_codon:yes stop_codon:yes gene_type:complete